MEYKLIFDYYDQPLSFVAKIKDKDYLFYYISDNEYFITLVDSKIAVKLNEMKNLTHLYKYLLEKNKVEVVSFDFDNEKATFIPFKEFKNAKNYLPISERNITFDFENEIKIDSNTNLLQYLDISNNHKLSDFMVRIFNPSNSHAYPSYIVQQIIASVSEYFNIVKEKNKFFNGADDLYIRAFQKGSFQIDFEIQDPDLRKKTYNSISEVINKVKEPSKAPDIQYLNEDYNRRMFINTKKMYDTILKKNNVTIEFKQSFNERKPKKVSFKAGPAVSQNIELYNKQLTQVVEKQNENSKVEHVTYRNASFRSVSINRNSLTFINKDDFNNSNKSISAEFDPKLFKKIKNDPDNKYKLTLRKPVTLEINIEKNEDKEKNIITDYFYNDEIIK